MNRGKLVAGVELGGTKGVAVLVDGTNILARERVPTTDPSSTLGALSEQLAAWRADGHEFAAIGIASFGPVGLDHRRSDYGHVTTTPKAGWSGTDIVGHFSSRFDVPIGFDTDVNGAAMAEGWWGASQDCDNHVYLTIGTGIGGGVVVGGQTVRGFVHPEIGHLLVRRRQGDAFPGICPYHGDCIEGLASGPAIAARAGRPASEVSPGDPVWADVAAELAGLMVALVLVASPERIVVGGGVGNGQPFLLEHVRDRTAALLAGYVAALDVDDLIRPPALGDDAGPLGAAAVAHLALMRA